MDENRAKTVKSFKKAKYLQYLELMDNTVLNTETNKSVSV